MSLLRIKLRLAAATLAAFSLAAKAAPVPPGHNLWTLRLVIKGACVSNLRHDWGSLQPFNRYGAQAISGCLGGTTTMGLVAALPAAPINFSWTSDNNHERHESVNLQQQLSKIHKTFNGGELNIVVDGDAFSIEYAARDENEGEQYWPNLPAVTVYSNNK